MITNISWISRSYVIFVHSCHLSLSFIFHSFFPSSICWVFIFNYLLESYLVLKSPCLFLCNLLLTIHVVHASFYSFTLIFSCVDTSSLWVILPLYKLCCFSLLVPFFLVFSDTYLLWKIGIIWRMDWNWDPWDNLLCQTLRGCQPETTALSAWRFCDFRSQTLRAGLWLWIWGCWWLMPLHPTPKLRQASFLAAHFCDGPSRPQWALGFMSNPLPRLFHGPQSSTELPGQNQALVLAHQIHCRWIIFMSTQWYIWRYFILFNITLLLRFYSAFGFVNWELLSLDCLKLSKLKSK